MNLRTEKEGAREGGREGVQGVIQRTKKIKKTKGYLAKKDKLRFKTVTYTHIRWNVGL